MIKNKLSKLTLRRETLTVLEMRAATGGAFGTATGGVVVAHTAHSICALCIPYPVIPPQEWPQTQD